MLGIGENNKSLNSDSVPTKSFDESHAWESECQSSVVIIPDPEHGGTAAIQEAMQTVDVRATIIRLGARDVFFVQDADERVSDLIRAVSDRARIVRTTGGHPLVDRTTAESDTVVDLGSTRVGDRSFALMAGPCAVEGRRQLTASAAAAREGGASVLRGGVFKPRTSPHAFQGRGHSGLPLLYEVARAQGLTVVSEVLDPRDLDAAVEHVDLVQIGTRNAQNYALLREVGRQRVPVLLKRGFGCTLDEWLGAAEYMLCEGNSQVILCERGIRTFEPATRFTLDLAGVAALKQRTHLPVIVDPSHGVGQRALVTPMALAAAAAGADGLLLDVHADPTSALCDADQALTGKDFAMLAEQLEPVLAAVGREMPVLESERGRSA